jgi:hypothetical protein
MVWEPKRHPGGRTCQTGLLMVPFVALYVLARGVYRVVVRR